jgi:AbiV family abortive infection protein
MDEKSKSLLSEMSRGVQLTFSNAEQLYCEGELLRKNGSLSRALFLHQISLEECGKIEIVGAWATNLLIGEGVDISKMTKAFRSHEAKNYANSYFAKLTTEEREARKRGAHKEAVEAFRRFQAKFHQELNTAKNASLYVDFKDGMFSAPSEVITEEMVVGIAAVNAYFLGLTGPKVRMLQRMEKDNGVLEKTTKWFVERVEELKASKPDELGTAMDALIQEMFDRYREEEARADKSK